jgi:hypothetical protein
LNGLGTFPSLARRGKALRLNTSRFIHIFIVPAITIMGSSTHASQLILNSPDPDKNGRI